MDQTRDMGVHTWMSIRNELSETIAFAVVHMFHHLRGKCLDFLQDDMHVENDQSLPIVDFLNPLFFEALAEADGGRPFTLYLKKYSTCLCNWMGTMRGALQRHIKCTSIVTQRWNYRTPLPTVLEFLTTQRACCESILLHTSYGNVTAEQILQASLSARDTLMHTFSNS